MRFFIPPTKQILQVKEDWTFRYFIFTTDTWTECTTRASKREFEKLRQFPGVVWPDLQWFPIDTCPDLMEVLPAERRGDSGIYEWITLSAGSRFLIYNYAINYGLPFKDYASIQILTIRDTPINFACYIRVYINEINKLEYDIARD